MRFALPENKWLKWILGIVGTLILSALGSGVWQLILGPALRASTRGVLDLASLGISNYKTLVYQQIAADNHNAVAVETLFFTMTLYVLAVFSLLISAYTVKDDVSAVPTRDPAVSIDVLKQEILKSRRRMRLLRFSLYVLIVFQCAVFINMFASFAKTVYINLADAHYHQVLHIAAPYLEAHEQAQVESDFAQISSRDDYVKVLSKLESQCKAHGKTVPGFDPW